MKRWMVATVLLALAVTAAAQSTAERSEQRISEQVRHELMMLPQYSTYDILGYRIDGDTVVLTGEVRNAVLQPEAEDAVKKIEGVSKVVNQIKVLPPSSFDDAIRLRVARAVFSAPGLTPYAMGVVTPIHIIVENGHVSLEGVVNSEADKTQAGMRANLVPGVFQVNNNLRVQS